MFLHIVRLLRRVVYGGTIVVVDEDRKVLLKLEKEAIKELPTRLSDLDD